MILDSAVLIHKPPASWNKEKNLITDSIKSIPNLQSNYDSLPHSLVFEEMQKSDIYYSIFIKLCQRLGINDIHIVQAFDNLEIRNYATERRKGYIVSEGIKFWSVDSIPDISPFFKCSLLMTRGQYPKFHSQMREFRGDGKGCWIHYPATARHYPWFEQVTQSWREDMEHKYSETSEKIKSFLRSRRGSKWKPIKALSFQGIHKSIIDRIFRTVLDQQAELTCDAYDIVLVDDSKSILSATNTFPNAYPLVFVKPGFPPEFEIKSGNREFDIIFCGTTLVPTKNHHSFMALVSELNREGRKFNICVVGDEGSIPEFTEFTNSYFANIQISNLGVVSRKEIFSLFAKSKICLVLSGRDCNPRIIAESGLHGCRVIAANTISDGFETLQKYPILGSILSTPVSQFRYDASSSPIPDISESVNELISQIDKSIHPISTSKLAISLFDVDQQVIKIQDAMRMLE